jgi:hypothetical protein
MIDHIPNLCHAVTDVPFGVELYQQGVDCFAVVYGQQVKTNLTYAQAAAEYGQCIMHALACASMLDNSDPYEDDWEEVDNEPTDKPPVMLPDWLVTQYEQRAAAEREDGGSCQINERLPTVAVTLAGGEEYFFQGDEAQRLLDEVPDNMRAVDFILASAQNW